MKSVLFSLLLTGVSSASSQPRRVIINGQKFLSAETREEIILTGPNVVVKGPPYLPEVSGNTYCVDVVNDECKATGTCTSCTTFNEVDVNHIKAMGWNSIRLGVTWAGAQPTDEDKLSDEFVKRLHAVLDLTDRTGLHVILDNHGDMVASAGCGNGVPMWFSQQAAPELIGKPLVTGLPYSLVKSIDVKYVDGYDTCGDDEAKWARYAGDPNYNLLNECCLAMNSPNPGGLGYTTIAQANMDYMVLEGPGRDKFVRYWQLLAEAVAQHPSAIAVEFMNEPMTIRRTAAFDTWRAASEAVLAVIPDMSVSVCNTGEGAVTPALIGENNPGALLSAETEAWIEDSSNVYYAWHWYGNPADPEDAVKNALALGESWNVPTFLTEFWSCDGMLVAQEHNISFSYWHYSSYCTTGPAFGSMSVPDETFGACILGWDGADSSRTC